MLNKSEQESINNFKEELNNLLRKYDIKLILGEFKKYNTFTLESY